MVTTIIINEYRLTRKSIYIKRISNSVISFDNNNRSIEYLH